METRHIATLFTALRGGVLRGLQREESTLRFKVDLPELARAENPDFQIFYGALIGCTEFSLQPFRNESTVLRELDQIERLEVEILESVKDGDRVKIFCSHKGVSTGARLSIRAEQFQLWNEQFDALQVQDLVAFRKKLNPGK